MPALFIASGRVVPASATQPDDWLWAWDRAEDLRWLTPDIGVAYFAA